MILIVVLVDMLMTIANVFVGLNVMKRQQLIKQEHVNVIVWEDGLDKNAKIASSIQITVQTTQFTMKKSVNVNVRQNVCGITQKVMVQIAHVHAKVIGKGNFVKNVL